MNKTETGKKKDPAVQTGIGGFGVGQGTTKTHIIVMTFTFFLPIILMIMLFATLANKSSNESSMLAVLVGILISTFTSSYLLTINTYARYLEATIKCIYFGYENRVLLYFIDIDSFIGFEPVTFYNQTKKGRVS